MAINNVSAVSKQFCDAYVEDYCGAPATYFAPLSYSAIMIIAEAVERAGSLDRDAVIAELKDSAYESPLGEVITFAPSNIISNQGIRNQKILQWQDGVQEVIWPFEFATAEPAFPFGR